MEYKRGQFKINGKHSEEFTVYMRDRPERPSAGRVIELRERPGNDSIVMDFKYYKNVDRVISCYAKANDFESVPFLENVISNWLDTGSYSDFIVYYDPHYIYQAVVISPPIFTGQRKNGLQIPFDFTVSMRPFKQSRIGTIWRSNEKLLSNTENYPSKPKIHIVGSGDISFWINEHKYDLKNIEEEIFIDSFIEESYRYLGNQLQMLDNKTFFKDYPILEKGENNIKWTGNVKEFRIQPRWWTKV